MQTLDMPERPKMRLSKLMRKLIDTLSIVDARVSDVRQRQVAATTLCAPYR